MNVHMKHAVHCTVIEEDTKWSSGPDWITPMVSLVEPNGKINHRDDRIEVQPVVSSSPVRANFSAGLWPEASSAIAIHKVTIFSTGLCPEARSAIACHKVAIGSQFVRYYSRIV